MKFRMLVIALSVIASFNATSSVHGMQKKMSAQELIQGFCGSPEALALLIDVHKTPLMKNEFGNTFLHYVAEKDDLDDDTFMHAVSAWLFIWVKYSYLPNNPNAQVSGQVNSEQAAYDFFKNADAGVHQYVHPFFTTTNQDGMTPFQLAHSKDKDGKKAEFLENLMSICGVDKEATSTTVHDSHFMFTPRETEEV